MDSGRPDFPGRMCYLLAQNWQEWQEPLLTFVEIPSAKLTCNTNQDMGRGESHWTCLPGVREGCFVGVRRKPETQVQEANAEGSGTQIIHLVDNA